MSNASAPVHWHTLTIRVGFEEPIEQARVAEAVPPGIAIARAVREMTGTSGAVYVDAVTLVSGATA